MVFTTRHYNAHEYQLIWNHLGPQKCGIHLWVINWVLGSTSKMAYTVYPYIILKRGFCECVECSVSKSGENVKKKRCYFK